MYSRRIIVAVSLLAVAGLAGVSISGKAHAQSRRSEAPPSVPALTVPATTTVSPGTSVVFALPTSASNSVPIVRQGGPGTLTVDNASDQLATAAYDGHVLTLTVAPGFVPQIEVAPSLGFFGCSSADQSASAVDCQIVAFMDDPHVAFSALASISYAVSSVATYQGGWNIVAGPTGSSVPGAVGSLYRFDPGSASYIALPQGTQLVAGTGYWAYFGPDTPVALTIPLQGGSTAVNLAAGTFQLIGNPLSTEAAIIGADVAYGYNPATASYYQTSTLAAGEGAWAYSTSGGAITLSNLTP